MTKSTGIGRGGARLGAGRKPNPPPVATTDPRLIVEQLAAVGEAPDVIARAVGCAPSLLRRRYRLELLRGHARRRAELIGLVWAKARAGNWAALKWLLDVTAVVGAEKQVTADPPRRRIGKKEAAQEAALTAGGPDTDWGSDLDHLALGGRAH